MAHGPLIFPCSCFEHLIMCIQQWVLYCRSYKTSDASVTPWQQCQGVFIGEFLFLDDVLDLYKNVEGRETGLPLMIHKPMSRRRMFGFVKKLLTFDKNLVGLFL